MVADLIADMFTIIRNGCRANKNEVVVPYSKLHVEILRILLEEGFINNFTIDSEKKPRRITVMLKYSKEGESVIRDIQRVSRCSRRVYVSKDDIPSILNGIGVAILTTSKGVMSDREARRKRIGGEVIGYVY
ncbi:MAG: 30S ribosomal protein S8 [candidate division WOR-3 bacterium]|nr:30S ribosomal protein S8 [candidate division WOR-3 bacterium]